MQCRLILIPDMEVITVRDVANKTYEEVLDAVGINPDTVLIRHRGRFLPQDKEIKEDEVEVILTCSRG